MKMVDLRAIVDLAVESSSTFIAENGQQLIINVPGKDEVRINGDPSRLTQVLSNLLNNSAKYSDAGSLIELNVVEESQTAVISVGTMELALLRRDCMHLTCSLRRTILLNEAVPDWGLD